MSNQKLKVNNVLCLKDKLEVVNNVSSLSVRQLCEKYKCGKTQIYSILKNKDKIKNELFIGERSLNSKRQSKSPNEDINKILFKWFIDAKSNSHPVTGPILQEQARLIAARLGNTTFKASNGWLGSFRSKYSISFKKDDTESLNHCCQIDADLNSISEITKEYPSHDIASCSEFGLFFKALPRDTQTLKHDKCHTGEKANQRFTVLVCGFADGTIDKPLIVSKSLPQFSVNPILADWCTNIKALMSSQLMGNWLFNLNERMKADNRNILLFLKKTNCHPALNFSNIRIVFFAANQKSPMDLGVINTVKTLYRTKLMLHVVANKGVCDLSKSITVMDGFRWLTSSFEEVTDLCVLSSFKNAGFPINMNKNDCHSIDGDLQNLIRLLKKSGQGAVNAKDYIDVDSNLSVEEEFQSLDELIKAETTVVGSDDEDNRDSDTRLGCKIRINSFAEALKKVKELEEFAISINNPIIQYQLFKLKSTIELDGALNS